MDCLNVVVVHRGKQDIVLPGRVKKQDILILIFGIEQESRNQIKSFDYEDHFFRRNQDILRSSSCYQVRIKKHDYRLAVHAWRVAQVGYSEKLSYGSET
jgi:hypothetical protein